MPHERPRREGDWRKDDEISIAGPEPRRRGTVMYADRAKKMLLVKVGPNEVIEVPFSDATLERGADKPRPTVRYDVGEELRIVDGPFNGAVGVVDAVWPDTQRLRVSVKLAGRPTLHELDFSQVQKT